MREPTMNQRFKVGSLIILDPCLWAKIGYDLLRIYRNPTLAKCEVKPNTPKVEDLESSRTLECLELDSKAQNTSH